MSAAAYLAKAGHSVTVFEKNPQPGGRAGQVRQKGFTFDTGPGWYSMPDVFEEFFADFYCTSRDFYHLTQIKPNYRAYFAKKHLDIMPAPEIFETFDKAEPGAGRRLRNYLHHTQVEYQNARKGFLRLDGLDKRQLVNEGIIEMLTNPSLLGSFHNRVKRVTKNQDLQQVLEFMTIYFGGSPQNIPGIYGIINWAHFGLGLWYPQGGFQKVVAAVVKIAESQGATIHVDAAVEQIIVKDGRATGVMVNGVAQKFDAVVSNADYIYTESNLLSDDWRSYGKSYWKDKMLSPAVVIGLVGVNRRLPLAHHNLFFDTDLETNFKQILQAPALQKKPLFYVTVPSVTERGAAPKGGETLAIMIPVSNKLDISDSVATNMVDKTLLRIAAKTNVAFFNDVAVKKVYGPEFFKKTFNATNGNAFGLAHTLGQSGPMRPRMQSKKVRNLFYVGHFTNPGTSVPLVLLSGKVVAKLISR